MTSALDKRAVAAHFSEAANHYDAFADIQRAACQLLAQDLPHAPGRWLDAGCGTGFAASLLTSARREGPLTGLDLALGMTHVAARAGYDDVVCADLERLPIGTGRIALYWSSLAWQWCNPGVALDEAFRVLQPGGHLLVGTLGPNTLRELREAFSGLDQARHVRDFVNIDTLHTLARASGFEQIEFNNEHLTAWLPNTAAVMRSLKQLGASELGPQRRRGLMGRATWAALEARYETHRSESGLPVTYDLILIRARKPR